jgi:hypothetical protein
MDISVLTQCLSAKRLSLVIRSSKRVTSRNIVESGGKAASAHKRLNWLLNFASRSEFQIKSLPENELRRLRHEVWCFPERNITQGGDDDLSIGIIVRLASRLGLGVNALMRGEPWLHSVGPVKLYLRLENQRADWRYITSHADGFFLEAVELIAAHAGRLRRCPREDCQKLFAANKRQRFCSSACSQAKRTERFLANHSRGELSAKRHARYVEQIKQQKGLPVAKKIRRRRPNLSGADNA